MDSPVDNPTSGGGRLNTSENRANVGGLFDKPLMTYDEAAAYATALWRKTSSRTVRRWVAIGMLKVLKPNGYNVGIEKAALDAMLFGHTKGTRKR